jgi:hypothetical protein
MKPSPWPPRSPPVLIDGYSFVYSHDFSNSTLLRCQRQLGGCSVTAGVGSASKLPPPNPALPSPISMKHSEMAPTADGGVWLGVEPKCQATIRRAGACLYAWRSDLPLRVQPRSLYGADTRRSHHDLRHSRRVQAGVLHERTVLARDQNG